MGNKKKAFVNTHTHIFTIKNVPPLIAKTFVPWPFYYLLHLKVVLGIYYVYESIHKKFKQLLRFRRRTLNFLKTRRLTRIFYKLFSIFLTFNAFVYLLNAFNLEKSNTFLDDILLFIKDSFLDYGVIYDNHWSILLAILASIFFFYPQLWKLFFGIAKKVISLFKIIPSTKSLEFIKRYFYIVNFTKYKSQKGIYDKLVKMYEDDSLMVVLPMDMEYMEAGKPDQTYLEQLAEINDIFKPKANGEPKKNSVRLLPFVFVDPRRIRAPKGKEFFDWDIAEEEKDGKVHKKVILKDCLLKDYLEKKEGDPLKGNFKGIKLYPALGYYPFDEDLLPLYHYCVDHHIPILTHCIQGTIFYRGEMKKKWNYHPVFKNANDTPLDTRTANNFDMQINFTHPLNYLVLLENRFLYSIIEQSKNDKLKTLFEFDPHIKFVNNKLKDLRINLAHYGGVEEWEKYLEADRDERSFELQENPDFGLAFTHSQSNPNVEKLSMPADYYKKKTEWFSIISSMMLRYNNVYSDISYILHSEKMMPLLYEMLLSNEKLSKKILYGTDFFVVRNHKSEKQLYADLLAALGEENMDLIARDNPAKWLHLEDS